MECFRCGKHDHYTRECRASCYNYGKAGHIAKFCRVEEKEKIFLIVEDEEEERNFNDDAKLRC